jgi:hypothetical protein
MMLNGEPDFSETSPRPLFELLGTPPDQKKQLVPRRLTHMPLTKTLRLLSRSGWHH